MSLFLASQHTLMSSSLACSWSTMETRTVSFQNFDMCNKQIFDNQFFIEQFCSKISLNRNFSLEKGHGKEVIFLQKVKILLISSTLFDH